MGETDSSVSIPGFTILSELGRGGFGTVYRALDLQTQEPLALKVSTNSPEARNLLGREYELLQHVGAPTVPRVISAGLHEGLRWIAMELVPWASLDQILAAGVKSVRERLPLLTNFAHAIASIHECEVIHLDLKPANIFVAADYSSVRLIDLGLAQRFTESRQHADARAGSPHYMSPEQCDPSAIISPASDAYSLGVVFYELVTGKKLFDGQAVEIQQAHTSKRPPILPKAIWEDSKYAELGDVIEKCLAKRPQDRLNAHEIVETLTRMRGSEAQNVGITIPPIQLVRARRSSSVNPPINTGTSAIPGANENRLSTPVSAAKAATRRMGILCFEPKCDANRLQRLVQTMRGRIGHADGKRTTVTFDSDASEAPMARVVRAAIVLSQEQALSRAVVGIADVTMHERRGREIMMSAAFQDPSFSPTRVEEGWLGILPEATPFVGEVELSAVPQSDLRGVSLAENQSTLTTLSIVGGSSGEKMVGADDLTRQLIELCRDSMARPVSNVAFVTSEPGLGKSILSRVLTALLSHSFPEACLLGFRAPESLLGDPFELTKALFRQLLDLPISPVTDLQIRLRKVIAPELAEQAWPAISVAMGWMAPTDREALQLAQVPGALRGMVTRVLTQLLLQRARRQGLIVILDDAHLTEDSVLEALDAVTLPEQSVSVTVIALGRKEPPHAPTWGKRAKHHVRLELFPLTAADAEKFVRDLLQPVRNIPKDVITHIVERGKANPRLLIEVVRGLKASGFVQIDPKTKRPSLAMDRLDEESGGSVVDWAAEREVGSLTPDQKAHAQLLALMGGPTKVEELAGVLRELDRRGQGEQIPLDARIGVEQLVASGLLTVDGPITDFRFPLLRDAVVKMVSPDMQKNVHQAAYAYYQKLPGEIDMPRMLRLAHHAEHAGETLTASEHRLELARQTFARHLYLPADMHLSRAIALLPPNSPENWRLRWQRGAVRYRLGRYADAMVDFEDARHGAPGSIEQAEILLEQATALDWMDDYARSTEKVNAAEELLAHASHTPALTRLRTLVAKGRHMARSGTFPPAIALLREADNLASSLGDVAYEEQIISLIMNSAMLSMSGKIEEAQACLVRARKLCESHHDRMHLIGIVQNEQLLHVAAQDFEKAQQAAELAYSLSRELGLVGSEYRQLYNLVDLLIQAGESDKALEAAERARESAAILFGAEHISADVCLLRARANLCEGKNEEAARAIDPLLGESEPSRNARESMLGTQKFIFRAIQLSAGPLDSSAWIELSKEVGPLDGNTDAVELFLLMASNARQHGDLELAKFADEQLKLALAACTSFYPLRIQKATARRVSQQSV